MSDAPNPGDITRALRELAELGPITRLVKDTALRAATSRRAEFVSQHADRHVSMPPLPDGLTRGQGETPYGNVFDVLERGVTSAKEGALIGTLLALSGAEEPPDEAEEETFVAHLTWLAAHTPCDALLAFDACLGDRPVVWRTLGRIATEPDKVAGDFGRVEALIAGATLATSTCPSAARERAEAIARTDDPIVRALLGAGAAHEALEGEMAPAPFGPVVTVALAMTFVLFVWQAVRLVGRLAFAYRRPASFRLTERGLELTHHVELLGRVLRERSTLIPLSNIVRVTREVRYARAGLYAGLASLVLGTYFGTGLFVDGMRVPGGSAPLVGLAVAFVVAGLLLDFVLSGAEDSVRGKCRLLVVPSRGRTLCLGRVDPSRADEMLAFVTEVARSESSPPPAPL